MLTSGLHPAHTCTCMHRYLHTQTCIQRDTPKKDKYSHQRTQKEEGILRQRGPGHLNVCPVVNSEGPPTLFSTETSGRVSCCFSPQNPKREKPPNSEKPDGRMDFGSSQRLRFILSLFLRSLPLPQGLSEGFILLLLVNTISSLLCQPVLGFSRETEP